MSQAIKTVLKVFVLLIIAALTLTTPAQAQSDAGRVIEADLTGVITMQAEDGTTHTIDYDGALTVGLRGDRIGIEITGAGVVRETAESVAFHTISTGVYQSEGTQIRFSASGEFTLEWEDGKRIAICPTGYGIIQQRGQHIVIDIIDAGVVEESGENVIIHNVGAGTRR